MKKYFVPASCLSLVFSLFVFRSFAQETNRLPETLESLQKRIAKLVTKPQYDAGLFGVKIVSLDTGKTIYEHDANKLCSPASNSKLYTMAMALDRLGPDYRIKTSLYAKGKPDENGVLKGDLVIYGRGDPTINLKLHGNSMDMALQPFVDVLTNAGVKQISGDLIGDDSYFKQPPYGSGWSCDDLENYYGAEISALTINDNELILKVKPATQEGAPCELTLVPSTGYLQLINRTKTVARGQHRNINLYRPLGENVVYVEGEMAVDDAGSNEDATFHNPAGMFVTLLNETLAKRGIKITGSVRTVNWKDREVQPFKSEEWVELGAVSSLPMHDIIREVQKPSQNLYTDLMLLHVGTKTAKPGAAMEGTTTEELGIKALRTFLSEIGIKRNETIFDEGSGLSRDNVTTPAATVKLLQHMGHHKCSDVYITALPIAGVDGTLRKRMKGTAGENNVHAKTGTLRWANSLSGYVTTASGERLVFSMMLNRYYNTDPNLSKTADMDAIAVMLAGFTGKAND
ncbi:D-alanyl-D-alanine carboxypeptidase/D-alanyl-D-alanine endopeptidase [Pedosphaera parvula]|uniref:D-alanyl-D-alanine carboxypeptidase/D-alanyl-D-alanine-endopeptidase n=1 Tax=Pedosphaera parvula (strain Ellin514) TaxID=320771 RepID=B9XRU4_PEDPL|nr:D-alanyl-D-alanine carboxypeptidase/D-alanyl-D-alanine-endopeptidase [Pedosphaera parvula]EEF57455.1 D-alanyl-D-alanine carboxypeptidase/D-alanyl-D-alanine-endopeptidase [Pedosphaera parvula Ellin514]